jgi:hypothetical protein
MTYEQFLNKVKENASPVTKVIPNGKALYCIYSKAFIGGMSGGNCWDTTEPTYRSNDGGHKKVRKTFDEEFDAIMQELAPNISFLKYKTLYNAVTEEYTFTENEYYGNTSEFLVMFVELKKLYEKMTEMDLI